jgi:hypothetical protein
MLLAALGYKMGFLKRLTRLWEIVIKKQWEFFKR